MAKKLLITLAGVILSIIVIIVVVILFYFLKSHDQNDGTGRMNKLACKISLNKDLTEPQPLLLKPRGGQENNAFYLPTTKDTIDLYVGQTIIVACPNGSVVLKGSSTKSEAKRISCNKSGKFSIGAQRYSFNEITCNAIPRHSIRYSGKSCWKKYIELEIGFALGKKRFIRLIRVCFDTIRQGVLYTQFTLSRSIRGAQKNYPRPSWSRGCKIIDLDCLKIDDLYKQQSQRIAINKQLGLEDSSTKYIRPNPFYLARGHLTAKTDFLYGSHQKATFYYANAAPQWQIFNSGNWLSLEKDVRYFAGKTGLDLTVFTGTYGVAALPHEKTGEDVELYLYIKGEKRGVPVPRLFWKLVYDPISKSGVVFVGVNNPYVFKKDYDLICSDICQNYKWLSWKASNVTLGYGYCCKVDDFARRLGVRFSGVNVNGILKTTIK